MLIGLSVLFTKLLAYVPLPVLYGVFIYMGLSSLKGNCSQKYFLHIFLPLVNIFRKSILRSYYAAVYDA